MSRFDHGVLRTASPHPARPGRGRKAELFDQFARESDVAKAAPEAVDVSEAELARKMVAQEQERLLGNPDDEAAVTHGRF